MKVRELIEKLQALDENLDVLILTANKQRDQFNESDVEDIKRIGLVPAAEGIFCGAVILSSDNSEGYLNLTLHQFSERVQELMSRQERGW